MSNKTIITLTAEVKESSGVVSTSFQIDGGIKALATMCTLAMKESKSFRAIIMTAADSNNIIDNIPAEVIGMTLGQFILEEE